MTKDFTLAKTYLPEIYHDKNEPFPIRLLGYTVFQKRGMSKSFKDLTLDPKNFDAEVIVEYAVYYDYDIQHLYDLEHIWVAAGENGTIVGCWGSFHGMRLRMDRLDTFKTHGTHPVLYAEPGKHAFLPDPALFVLHDQYPACCSTLSGGGLLIPPFLTGRLESCALQDECIHRYIRGHYAFTPSEVYRLETVDPKNLIPWDNMPDAIIELINIQLAAINNCK